METSSEDDHMKDVAPREKNWLCAPAMPQTISTVLGKSLNFHLPSYKVQRVFSFCPFILFFLFSHTELLGQPLNTQHV